MNHQPLFISRMLWFMIPLILLVSCGKTGNLTTPPATKSMALFVPLYGYPNLGTLGNDWQRVADASARLSVTAVINPSSGPLSPPPQAFLNGIQLLQAAGVTVLGYVDTAFTRLPRTQARVKQDIDAYKAYGVDGIFFDQVASIASTGNTAYYQSLCSYSRSITMQSVLNPGTAFPNAYLDPAAGCDAAVVYEDTEANWTGYRLSAENARLNSKQLIALVHTGVTDLLFLQASLNHAAALGIGSAMVTDRTLSSLWLKLPTYWTQEVNQIVAIRLP